ncbi:MAG: hypothetical protein ACI9CQ_004470 [Saprospiraceae bacterium]|jgi:hypothetical protein
MKKRMQILMSMTLTAFLFLGLTSLNAQSFTTGPTTYAGPNGKTEIDYQQGADATATIQTEIQSYGLTAPVDPTTVGAENFYRVVFLKMVSTNIASGEATAGAIFRGYNATVNKSKGAYPGLVNATWQEDMITLLSN